jgi:hypothetical protein
MRLSGPTLTDLMQREVVLARPSSSPMNECAAGLCVQNDFRSSSAVPRKSFSAARGPKRKLER